MSNLTEKDRSIIKQVAFKAAVEVTTGFDTDQYLSDVKGMSLAFEEILLQMHDESPAVQQAVATITEIFPGATVEPAPVTAPTAVQVPNQALSTTTTISGASSTDELWQNLIGGQPHGRVNEAEWYDNRRDKKNPAGPDFVHKNLTKGTTNSRLGLWLGGKYPAPAFAVEHFQ